MNIGDCKRVTVKKVKGAVGEIMDEAKSRLEGFVGEKMNEAKARI